MSEADRDVKLSINGTEFTVQKREVTTAAHVPASCDARLSLAGFLRSYCGLTGTKLSCYEGGCGACVVSVTRNDPLDGRPHTRAVNSCLVPVRAARGWVVTTVEGLGDTKRGLHPIQRRLAERHGTQCGFCTPGFVMSAHSLLAESGGRPAAADVERAVDGNLCRCTGYRPILDALKSFTADQQPIDIEEVGGCGTSGRGCGRHARLVDGVRSAQQAAGGARPAVSWTYPASLKQLFACLADPSAGKTRMVFGNTATGVYKADVGGVKTFIDLAGILEMYHMTPADDHIAFGANLTLTSLAEKFTEVGKERDGYRYLVDEYVPYIYRIASTPVRNVASWAGNLMVQHAHPEFVADLLTPLVALDAKLVIVDADGENVRTLEEFLSLDMTNKVIVSVRIPKLGADERLGLYRTAPRTGNSHAYVCSSFWVKLVDKKVADVKLSFNGIASKYTPVTATQQQMLGKQLDSQMLEDALNVLGGELKAADSPLVSGRYKASLGRNLFYKFLKSIQAGKPPTGLSRCRPVSCGSQDFGTDPLQYPLTSPQQEINSNIRCTGEAEYTGDLAAPLGQLFASVVGSTHAKATITHIDTSAALNISGVVDVITHKDIPDAKLLVEKNVTFYNQPVAIVVADSAGLAWFATRLVKVTYADVQTPLVDFDEAMRKGSLHPNTPSIHKVGNTEAAFSECDHIFEDTEHSGPQYHFYMEPQKALCIPKEGNLDVWTSTQSPTLVQGKIAKVMNMQANNINVNIARVGGGFGGKFGASAMYAAMCAVAATRSGCPVLLELDHKSCMYNGRRFDLLIKYKVGMRSGMIHALETEIYADNGCEPTAVWAPMVISKLLDGPYYIPNYKGTEYCVKTDTATVGAMRSPVNFSSSIFTEHLICRVAQELKEDINKVKERHLLKDGQTCHEGLTLKDSTLCEVWETAYNSSDMLARCKAVDTFNKENRWVKRGMAITPARYGAAYSPTQSFGGFLAIYALDGSVAFSHGAVDLGQGLNVRSAQMISKLLKVPIEKITVKQTNTLIGVNSGDTGGSHGSNFSYKSLEECCLQLVARLQPVRDEMPDADWMTIVSKAHSKGISLAEYRKYAHPKDELVYNIEGACVAEVELDVLTGEHRVNRADVVMDLGESLNPAVDIGQVEGALVMGQSHMTHEKLVTDPATGRILTDSTWTYKPPTALDIPVDMRVTLLRDRPNVVGITPSKAVGEPPMCVSPAFLAALQAAVQHSRSARGRPLTGILDAPSLPEDVYAALDLSLDDLLMA